MVARGCVGREGQPLAFMIAPTTSLVSSFSMNLDAALRIADLFNDNILPAADISTASSRNGLHLGRHQNRVFSEPEQKKVHLVHGKYDQAFCPNQHRWNGVAGVDLHVVDDNHICCRQSTLRLLINILRSQLNTICT